MEEMVRAQKEMLQRFEKTNEMLTNVNSLSAVRLEKVTYNYSCLLSNIHYPVIRLTMTSRSTLRML